MSSCVIVGFSSGYTSAAFGTAVMCYRRGRSRKVVSTDAFVSLSRHREFFERNDSDFSKMFKVVSTDAFVSLSRHKEFSRGTTASFHRLKICKVVSTDAFVSL